MRTRSRLHIFIVLLFVTGLLCHCDDPEVPVAGPTPVTSTGAEAAYAHTRNIISFGPRPPGSAGLRKTRGYLTEQLEAAGWQVGSQRFTAPTPIGERTFINLLARFGATNDTELWKKPVTGILACHIDSKTLFDGTKFVGADDAASAAGLLLELARQLAATPERAGQIELVFFDGEESFGPRMTPRDGIYGSRKYASRWAGAASKPGFGIVLDMIGHRDLQIRFPPDSPPNLAALLRKSAAAEGAAERFAPAAEPILDDHVPLNNAGIPTIDIVGDFTNADWWHTDRDNLALISRESLDLTLRITTRMLDDLIPAAAAQSPNHPISNFPLAPPLPSP